MMFHFFFFFYSLGNFVFENGRIALKRKLRK